MKHSARIVKLATILTIAVLCEGGCTRTVPTSSQAVLIDLSKLNIAPKQSEHLHPLVRFVPVESSSGLPEPIKTRIGGKMADPGKAFNAGDDITLFGTPNRRLIFAGRSDQYCVVHYETGGVGHGFVVALFETSGAEAVPIWAHAGIKFSNIEEFRKAVDSHSLENEVRTVVW